MPRLLLTQGLTQCQEVRARILLAPWGWSSCQKETLQETDKAMVINLRGGRVVQLFRALRGLAHWLYDFGHWPVSHCPSACPSTASLWPSVTPTG